MRFAPPLAFVVLASLLSCRTTRPSGDDVDAAFVAPHPAPHPALAASAKCPDGALMLAAFHQGALKGPLAPVAERAAAVVEKCPQAWEAHEVAALVARLQGHDDDAFKHFMAAAADTRATDTRFFLAEMDEEELPVSLELAALAFLDDVTAHHPDLFVRADAAGLAIRLRKELGAPREPLPPSLGVIEAWQIVGAFDNDQGKGFLTEFPPEDHVDLHEKLAGRVVDVTWRKVTELERDGSIPVDDLVAPSQQSVAYLATWLEAPAPAHGLLVVQTDAAFRVFVNGRLTGEEQKVDGSGNDAFEIPVELGAGENELLIKTANESGAWKMRARLVDDKGAALAQVTARDTPSSPNKAAAGAMKAAAGAKGAAKAGVRIAPAVDGDAPRALFLKARTLARAGIVRDALETARRYAGASKDNPLAVLLVSQLLKRNQEAGKAIDLVNRAIGDDAHVAPAALVLDRARFYSSKRRWDAAQEDLTAILEKEPAARSASQSLAYVFERRDWQIDRCRAVDAALAHAPDDTALVEEKGQCLRARGLRADAKATFLHAFRLEPGDVSVLRSLAWLAMDAGDLDDARAWYARAAAVDDVGGGPFIDLARVAHAARDKDGERALLEKAHAISPDDPRPLESLGNVAYDDVDKAQALALWRSALERDPQDSDLAVHIEFVAGEGLGALAKYAPSREQIARAIAAAQKQQAAPGSNVVYIIDHEATEVYADGSTKSVVTEVHQAVNQRGRDQLIATDVPRGETRILDAHSITPSGEVQEASSITSGTIRFRALEVGSITVVQYVTHRQRRGFLPNHYVETWSFSGMQRDVRDATWILVTPKERKLVARKLGDVDEKITDDGNKRVYTWSAHNVAPLLPEPNMPPVRDLTWHVSVSTLDGWDEYVRWEQALLKDAFRSNPEVDELAARLLQGAGSTQEKIDRLFHYVSKEIRYTQEYETTIAGVKPHACPVVLERGYGDCKDKAVLLILLLQKAGVAADFAILRTTDAGKVEKDVPNQQFNHAIVYVRKQPGVDDGYFTDPTTDALDLGNLRSDDQGAVSLVLEPEGSAWHFEEIPYQAPQLESSAVAARIDPSTTKAHVELSTRGAGASQARRAVRDAETEKKLMQGWGTFLWPGATLEGGKADTSEDLGKPFTLTVDVDMAAGIHDDGAAGKRIDVPHLSPFDKLTTLAERKLPLRLGIHDTSTVDMTVAVPAKKKVMKTPADFHVEHPCFKADRVTTATATEVHTHIAYVQTCSEIAAADYPAFRAKALEVVAHEHDPIVLSP